jgi:hypothetical protein
VAGKIRRKGKPWNPALAEYQQKQEAEADAKKRDRKATDLLRNARVAAMEVDDPISGDKIVILRSTRDDPLADHHARGHIDEAQYQAGRAFQGDFQRAERGPKAIELKEWVDGGLPPEPLTEGQRKAAKQLAVVYRELGANGSALVHDVLVHGRTMIVIAAMRGLTGKDWEQYFGKRFRECLDCLAVVYGYAMRMG